MLIPVWQRLLAIFLYMIPLSDAIPFGGNLFRQFPWLLKWITLPALPILILEKIIPLGSLVLFFILFLAVIRNSRVPYFIRFNTLQALLIDIAVVILSYAFQVIIFH